MHSRTYHASPLLPEVQEPLHQDAQLKSKCSQRRQPEQRPRRIQHVQRSSDGLGYRPVRSSYLTRGMASRWRRSDMSAQQRAQTELVASSWLLWDGGELNGSLRPSQLPGQSRDAPERMIAVGAGRDNGCGDWHVACDAVCHGRLWEHGREYASPFCAQARAAQPPSPSLLPPPPDASARDS